MEDEIITVMFGDYRKQISKDQLPLAKKIAMEAIAEALSAGMTIEEAKLEFGLKILEKES